MSEPIMDLLTQYEIAYTSGTTAEVAEARTAIEREVAALRERAERAESALREAPHEPHCTGQLDVRVWPQETRIICCTCFKRRYQEDACQTNPA